MAIATFLDAFDMSGKRILTFCMHEGSSPGNSESMIRKLCLDVQIAVVKAIVGSTAANACDELLKWVKTIFRRILI